MTLTGAAPAPTAIVFGTDGWRARIADEFTYDNVRRCADGVAAYVVERGEPAKGVVIAYDRRFASEHFAMAAAEVLLAHDIPVAFAVHAVPTQMSSYEVVERGAAAGIVITASHNPWVDNGFKVKAPTGAAAGADILSVIEARLAVNGGIGIDAAAVRRRRGGRARRAVRSVRGLRAVRPPDGRPRRAQGRRHVGPGRPDVGRRQRLAVAPAGRRPDPGQRDPPGAQPVLRRRQPRADPPEHRRGARHPRRRRLRPGPASSTATPIVPARPTSAGRSSTSSRSRGC